MSDTRYYYDIESNENIVNQLKEAGIYDVIMSWEFGGIPYIKYFNDRQEKSNPYDKTVKAHASIEDIAVLGSGAKGYIKLSYLDKIKEAIQNQLKLRAEKDKQA